MTSSIDHSWLGGAIADLPTPFDANGSLDLPALARLSERQIAAGATAMLVRTAVATARGRIRVIAGAGSNATAQAIALAQQAEHAGADAILCVVPYYNKPTQAGIAAHFRAIAAATSLPIIVHDAPGRTMRPLADDTLVQLAESAQFIGLCDGSGDISRPLRLRGRLPRGFVLLSGHADTAIPFLFYAGDGCISAITGIAPALMREMHLACRQCEVIGATELMDRLAPLGDVLAQDPTPASLKYALSLLQLSSPRLRLPMVEPSSTEKIAIAEAMAIALGP
jgi:4-hydroxy-tetrahydrodipicolinate synthase